MLAEIITFAGIVCAGVLTRGEREMNAPIEVSSLGQAAAMVPVGCRS